MATLQGELSKTFLDKIDTPGRYSDGRGRFGLSVLVRVRKDGKVGKYFSQRLRINGKWAYIGLGSYPRVSLSKARAAALENVQKVDAGLDPRPDKGGAPVPATPTFTDAVGAFHETHAPTWKGGAAGMYARKWLGMLNLHAVPKLGSMPVDAVGIADVKAVIAPIWDKRHTAMKVHKRIGAVMDWAISEGHRTDNPCGAGLLAGLPKNGVKTAHFRAMHHADVQDVLMTLRELGVDASKRPAIDAFEFLTLTATRSNETRGARWSEIELCGPEQDLVWTIPADRMKTGVEHRVPITPAMVNVLARAQTYSPDDSDGLIFPAQKGGVMGDAILSRMLKRNGVESTVHGMRSTFRDWAAENAVERDVAESALAHKVKGVEGAYFRSDLLERRREVMERWANYVTGRDADAEDVEIPGRILRFVA